MPLSRLTSFLQFYLIVANYWASQTKILQNIIEYFDNASWKNGGQENKDLKKKCFDEI